MTHLSRHSVVAPILTAPLLTDTCRSTVGPGTREDIVVTVYSFVMVYIAPALASIKLLQYRSTCSGGGGLLFLERPQHLLQWRSTSRQLRSGCSNNGNGGVLSATAVVAYAMPVWQSVVNLCHQAAWWL